MVTKDAIDSVVKYLCTLPKGTETSTKEALEYLGYFDMSVDECLSIDNHVRVLAGAFGLILDEEPYGSNLSGMTYDNIYCIRAKDGKLSGIQKIDITEWLKNTYGQELDPAILSVEFCQSFEEVWLNVQYGYESDFGLRTLGKTVYLDFAKEPYEKPLDIVPEGKSAFFEETFSPGNDIEENVAKLITDKVTLENMTTFLD